MRAKDIMTASVVTVSPERISRRQSSSCLTGKSAVSP